VQDLFVFTQTGIDPNGQVQGYLSPTGLLPTFHHKLVADGFTDLSEHFFQPETYGYPRPQHFLGRAPLSPTDTEVGTQY
jgi:hypothetical protein